MEYGEIKMGYEKFFEFLKLKNSDKMMQEIYVKGFENVGISYEELSYILLGKNNLNLLEKDIINLFDGKISILELPITSEEKYGVIIDVYEIWEERRPDYLNNRLFDDTRVEISARIKQRNEYEKNKQSMSIKVCPNCKTTVKRNDNYCTECGFKLK